MAINTEGALAGASAGGSVGGPWGAAIGGAVGAFLPSGGAPSAPSVAFNPANISTGAGSVNFDQGANTFTSALDPRLRDIQESMFAQGLGFFDELSTFDPDQFGANVSDRLRNLAAPKEEQDRLNLENRLFKQGLLNSTLGGERQENLFSAQALAEEARLARGFSLGQDVQGNLLNRGLRAFDAGTSLEQLPLQLLGTSIAGGSGNLGADTFNATNTFETSLLQSDIDAAGLQGLFDAIGKFGSSGTGGTSFGTSFENFFGGTDFSDADLDFFNTYDIGE